jgi:hypothetical protein
MKHLYLGVIALLLSIASMAQVAPISGPLTYCVGSAYALTDATPGGTWSSTNPAVATMGVTGILSAITPGTIAITYTVGVSYAMVTVTVLAAPSPISGPSSLCVGTTIMQTCSPAGGIWTSSSPAIAAMGTLTGIASGITAGTAVINYSLGIGCSVSKAITVTPTPPAISGSATVCLGSTTTLMDLMLGGTWSSLDPTIAICDIASGVVTGIVAGTASIRYSISLGCYTTTIVTVSSGSPLAFTVTGGGSYCTGGAGVTVGLSGSSIGVSYQLDSGGVAIGTPMAGTGSPLNFGLQMAPGAYNVLATTGGGCAAAMSGSAIVTVSALPTVYALTGGGTYCAGGTGASITLSNSESGVTYQLINGTSLVGAPVAGTGSPIVFGSLTAAGVYAVVATNSITFCTSTMTGTITVSIAPLPAVYTVTGGGSYCTGGTGINVELSGSALSVNYGLFLGTSMLGTPVPGTGTLIDFGPQTIAGIYTVQATDLTTGCSSNMTGSATIMAVTPITPTVSITSFPGATICPGATATFTAIPTSGGITPGYVWSVNGTVVAGATDNIFISSPSSGDIVSMDMASAALCAIPGTATASVTITVDVPIITAAATTACGGTVTLAGGGGVSYSWVPVTGLSCSGCSSPTMLPSATTIYTLTGTDGTGCTATATISTDGDRISGHISYSGGVSTDTFKVWLIQFNTSDSSILALDSTMSCLDAGVPYYEFMDKAAGGYMAKAQLNSAIPGTSGYMPTYSLSAPHWDLAAAISHAGVADNLDITMLYGAVPSGPGFISGYVVSGAGKGTAGDAPAGGMNIYLKSSTGTLFTSTTTAADGTYSFSNLADDTYEVYPENFNFHTTPSLITLVPGADSATATNFKQRTTSRTITPYDNTKANTIINLTNGISVYPNPATDYLNINWGISAGNATVILSDMTGREIYNATLNLDQVKSLGAHGHEISQIILKGLNNGIYLLTIKGAQLNHFEKVVVAK